MKVIKDWFFEVGDKKPSFNCPDCGTQLLGDTAPHSVDANGIVRNSVKCPCGFHENVQLESWDRGFIPKGKLK